jgi:hypothetical protein
MPLLKEGFLITRRLNMSEYMTDAQGRRVPVDLIKGIDLLRDQTVKTVMEKTRAEQQRLKEFKKEVWKDIQTFLEISADEHHVQYGGKKGNVSLISYDGRYKILVQVSDTMQFNEKLQIAKTLIDNCIRRWSDGSRPEIKTLVDDAFQVDKQGNINKGRILGLRRLNISDKEWQEAMQAITDSIQVISSKTYIRFYERNEQGEYVNIPLDVAAL